MIVERRSEARRKTSVVAYLGMGNKPPTRCKTVDLSASGALVTAPDRMLEHGERVKFILALDFGKVVKTYHRRAIVVRVSEGGVALRTFRQRARRRCEELATRDSDRRADKAI